MKRQRVIHSLLFSLSLPLLCFSVAEAVQDQPASDERPGLLRRKLDGFLKDDESSDGGRGVHVGPLLPRLVILSSGGGPGPVLHFWAPDLGDSAFDVHASAGISIHAYRYYDAQVGLVPHVGSRLPRIATGTNSLFPLADLERTSSAPGFNLYASARFRDYPREDFYGLGPLSRRTAHADYRLQDGLYEGVMRFRVWRLSLMGRLGILRTSILPGEDDATPDVQVAFTPAETPGLLRAPDFNHVSVGGWFEGRDEPANPHRGVALGVAHSWFNDRHLDAFAFRRLTAEAREYIPLGSNRHVIALRQATSLDRAEPGHVVPFYLRSSLGGSSLLSAYPSFRYRDDGLLYLASEYRFEVRPKVELALIYQAGKVFPETSGFHLHDFRTAYGVGIRLKSPKKVRLRLDVLHGREGTRAHLKLGPSF